MKKIMKNIINKLEIITNNPNNFDINNKCFANDIFRLNKRKQFKNIKYYYNNSCLFYFFGNTNTFPILFPFL